MKNRIKQYWGQVGRKIKTDLKAYYFPMICLGIYVALACIFRFYTCPVQLLFSVPCPGCGITRALIQLVQGHFLAAWNMHPFVYIVVASAVIFVILRYFTNVSLKWFEKYCTIIGVFMIAFYIYRMIRFFPGEAPMDRSPYSLLRLVMSFFKI